MTATERRQDRIIKCQLSMHQQSPASGFPCASSKRISDKHKLKLRGSSGSSPSQHKNSMSSPSMRRAMESTAQQPLSSLKSKINKKNDNKKHKNTTDKTTPLICKVILKSKQTFIIHIKALQNYQNFFFCGEKWREKAFTVWQWKKLAEQIMCEALNATASWNVLLFLSIYCPI